MALPLVGLGISLAVGAYGQSQQNQAKRSQARRQREAYDEFHSELEGMKAMTTEERQYMDRMQTRAKDGDPNLGRMRNIVMSNISQARQAGAQGAQAIAIQSGLENSIIADELRRRVDRDTLEKVAQESTKLAMHNSQYKEKYQGQLDQFQLQRAQYIRGLTMQQAQSNMQKANIASGSEINQMGWGGFLKENASSIAQFGTGVAGTAYSKMFPNAKGAEGANPGNWFTPPQGAQDEQIYVDPDGRPYKLINGQKVYI